MSSSTHRSEQVRVLRRVLQRARIRPEVAWVRYFSLGGSAGPVEVEAYVEGLMELPTLERDVLAQAANELLDEQAWPERVPYSRPVRQPRPSHGPLAALVDVVEGMHLAPPDRLPDVVARAGEALGVQLVVYLVDYEQVHLHPLTGAAGVGARRPLGVDTSLAGRAFRTLEILPGLSDGEARLWVPLLDGVERLGVLDVVLTSTDDVNDPHLRAELSWLANTLGHLVVTSSAYGDALDRARRTRPRSTAGELVWQLLPPSFAGTESVAVAAWIEPCYTVGGDAFDYALSETTAHLAIFDATGHSLNSGLITATAMSAYRSVRRDGGSLFDQAMAVDEVVRGGLDRTGLLATAVLAELDLRSGRLRYISGGHPYPLVLRRGKLVRTLTDGRRPIFGVSAREMTVGEEVLEPGDWLVLYTDGITEARGEDGSFFGLDRLVDLLEREIAAGHPPPEMVRRLARDVLAYQRGVLQDDATALVVQWDGFSWTVRP